MKSPTPTDASPSPTMQSLPGVSPMLPSTRATWSSSSCWDCWPVAAPEEGAVAALEGCVACAEQAGCGGSLSAGTGQPHAAQHASNMAILLLLGLLGRSRA